MAEIKQAAAPVAAAPAQQAAAPVQQLWPIIGKAWINTDKKGRQLVSLVVGNRREPFAELVLKPNDRLVLRPNQKREGKRDADYQVCLAPAQA